MTTRFYPHKHTISVKKSQHFDLGNVENIIVEGKDVKVVCANINENKVSVFMEKTTDHANVLKQISP